jgi:ketosteroid isomerase-like protein
MPATGLAAASRLAETAASVILYGREREEDVMDDANRELVERFFAASGRGDLGAVASMLHEDMVMEWPQSGERFTGRENALGAMRSQEAMPEIVGTPRIVGSGDTWVAMMPLRYGEDIYHYVAVIELQAGSIRRGTGYFAAPFPPQPARARYADGPATAGGPEP